ncbi:Membrane protein of uncharacterised function (DUF340) [Edwardsiella tarda]|nr:Membrane protein of uncharacterised function (DUF340) [Edwardsiella tarda]
MYSGLLIILVPLLLGYLLPLHHKTLIRFINRMLSWMVYLILFFMGISLAFLDNLGSNLWLIAKYASLFFVLIIGANLLALWLLEKRYPWRVAHRQEALPSRLHMALESLKLCGVVVGGFLLGLTQWPWLSNATHASEYALIWLLFLVGLQLRNSGMSPTQILLNRRGMMIGCVVCVSALAGGALAAALLGLPIKTGLAIASAYGWYSLSGIMLTEAFGPGDRQCRLLQRPGARAVRHHDDPDADPTPSRQCVRAMRRHLDGLYPARLAAQRWSRTGPGRHRPRLPIEPVGTGADGALLLLRPEAAHRAASTPRKYFPFAN